MVFSSINPTFRGFMYFIYKSTLQKIYENLVALEHVKHWSGGWNILSALQTLAIVNTGTVFLGWRVCSSVPKNVYFGTVLPPPAEPLYPPPFSIWPSIYFFFFLWLHWVFVATRGVSLVASSGGYSLLRCAGFSLRWLLLLWSTGSRHVGFSSCGTRAQ